MVEEFQEADVLWPDYTDDQQQEQEHSDDVQPPTREDYSETRDHEEPCRRASLVAAGRNATSSSTKPVRVPVPSQLSRSLVSYFLHGAGDIGDDYIGSSGMMSTPPHIVASRRMREKKVAFSMCSGGKGRTLKGRDLRRVRNAVLKMTGFLES